MRLYYQNQNRLTNPCTSAGIDEKKCCRNPPDDILTEADAKSGLVPLALKLAGQNETFAVCYATEASLFQVGGAPSVVIGPGNIAQAHTPNEFLAVAELEKCLAFLARVADWAAA